MPDYIWLIVVIFIGSHLLHALAWWAKLDGQRWGMKAQIREAERWAEAVKEITKDRETRFWEVYERNAELREELAILRPKKEAK
jgi:hypothetical protein